MTVNVGLVDWATEQATTLLAPLGNRWLHVQGVVEQACWVGKILNEENRNYLIAAAYLHDIGYAPSLKKTGFHPLDGAEYVRSTFGDERLACLVAHHSEARFEAQLWGVADALAVFPRERSATADALLYCDMTTGPTGMHVSLKERTAEVLHRYGKTHVVAQSVRLSMPYVALAVGRTQKRLRKYGLL